MKPINITELTLKDIVDVIQPMFDDHLQSVRKNIQNGNTKSTDPRTVQITLTIIPDDKRELGTLFAKVNHKLAPTKSEVQVLDLTEQKYLEGLYVVKQHGKAS